MSKHVLEMRTVVNETDLSRLAGKWFAFMRDLEKKTVAEVETSYEEMINEIDLFEFNLSQNGIRVQTAEHDVHKLKEQESVLGKEIAQGGGKIVALKDSLVQERQERKHQEEYDAIAATILQHHDRATLAKEVDSLQKDIAQEEQDKSRQDRMLEMRSKQFQLLLTTIEDLEEELVGEKDDAEDDAMQT
jgi:THO complex subunit 7|uniref:Leucine zipper transcription factor-like protein 1 n=1 Tax=Eutreptiella gymnastica TaxID=73025 RepID=A0A7S4GJH7_9EUGL